MSLPDTHVVQPTAMDCHQVRYIFLWSLQLALLFVAWGLHTTTKQYLLSPSTDVSPLTIFVLLHIAEQHGKTQLVIIQHQAAWLSNPGDTARRLRLLTSEQSLLQAAHLIKPSLHPVSITALASYLARSAKDAVGPCLSPVL